MARDGSGNYNLPSGQPVSTGTTISSTVHNTFASDVASALTQSISKDGQTTPTANLPMGGFKHTNVADASIRTQYASAGQIQDGTLILAGSVSGTDTITASLNPAISGYVGGMEVNFVPAATNTGAVTLALNGLSAKSLKRSDGSALVAGDMVTGQIAHLIYNGTNFILQNPATAGAVSGTTGTFSGAVTGASFIPSGASVPTNGLYLSAANTPALASNSTLRWSVNSTGNHVFAAPSSGTAFTVSGPDSAVVAAFLDTTSTAGVYARFGDSVGSRGYIGFGSSTFSGAAISDFGIAAASGVLRLSANGGTSTQMSIASAGNVAIAAPSSGNTLALTQGASDLGLTITNGSGTLTFQAGGAASTINTPGAWGLNLSTNSTTRLSIASTGGISVQPPTSGTAFTVNAKAGEIGAQIAGDFSGNWPIEVTNTGGATTGRTAISFVRTGGTNKQWVVGNDTDGSTDNSFDVRDVTRGAIPFSIGTSGNITIAAAASGDELTVTGSVVATSFAGDGSGLTALSATQLTGGTVPDARFPATLPAASGANLTALNATQLTSGTVPSARITAVDATATISSNLIGYRDIPRRTSGFARGEVLAISAGVTLNTSDMATGYAFSLYNDSGSNITITQGSGVTMRLHGTSTTGSRTLLARGFATIWCNSGTEAICMGDIS